MGMLISLIVEKVNFILLIIMKLDFYSLWNLFKLLLLRNGNFWLKCGLYFVFLSVEMIIIFYLDFFVVSFFNFSKN